MDLEKKFLSDFFADLNANRVVLPTLPEVALQVRRAVGDPRANAARIERIINADPALSAKLLKVANSPAYRGSSPITNLRLAITRLGINMVRNLATSLVMEQLYQTQATEAIRQRLTAQWRHSTQVATLSEIIARHYTSLKPDEAMLAGLIHDIGALPVLNRASLAPELLQEEAQLDTVIEKLHTLTGPAVLDAWGFAPYLVTAAAEHEQIREARQGPVDHLDVVIVANLHSHLGRDHPLGKVNWDEVPAFGRLDISPDESIALMERARDELQEMQEILTAA
jgi:HD-like signal output (HDOD) protein